MNREDRCVCGQRRRRKKKFVAVVFGSVQTIEISLAAGKELSTLCVV